MSPQLRSVTAGRSSLPSAGSLETAAGVCYLCGLHLPKRPHGIRLNERSYQFCCSGCRQVFLLLSESGVIDGDFKSSDLYQMSLKLGIIGKPDDDPRREEPTAEELKDAKELVLRVDGMWCSSCSWLIEKVVGAEQGVVHSCVIYASDTAKIFYRPEQISPVDITKKIEKLGYTTSARDADPKERIAERRSLLIKMGVALFLMMNTMFFSYVLYIGYFQELTAEIKHLIPFILLLFSIPSVFWCALPIHHKAYRSVLGKSPTMELLFSIGIFSAFGYSVYSLMMGESHFYFDTASSLTALLLVGKFIELSAKQKASESIHRLYQMLPKKVRIKAPEGDRLVSTDKLQEGDVFVVKSGEKIPADGQVVLGRAVVDESLLTGESRPLEKNIGDSVIASSMNVNGVLEITAQRIGERTIVSGIIKMVETALSSKSPLEQTVNRIARVFIPFVLALAFSIALYLLATGVPVEIAITRAITVLVIACPCALGMATPLAIAAGIGYAANHGILIRDARALHIARKVSTVIFDKTGTITEGKFSLVNLHSSGGDENETLQLLGSVEQASNHPIASAIVEECKQRSLALSDVREVRVRDGKGIEGNVGNKKIVIGNEQFLSERGFIVADEIRELIDREKELARTVVLFGVNSHHKMGYISFGDSLKVSAVPSVSLLIQKGISVVLLSGDALQTTSAIARRAGIGSYAAQVLPAGKIETIRGLQSEGKIVAMVGDGVNDAPALAQSDVGIAMGNGMEIAVESAPLTLLRDDLGLVPEAIEISKRTVRTVTQNLVWAFAYNTVGIVIAVLGFLNPLMAALAMLASSLSVVGNSLRLREGKGEATRKLVEIFLPWREPAIPGNAQGSLRRSPTTTSTHSDSV